MICLLDNTAVDEVLRPLEDAVEKKVLVNLTSGTPAQARSFAHWVEEHHASYIDGKILADPPDVGSPNAQFLFSSKSSKFTAQKPILESLGTVTYYGEDPGAAAVEFMAQVALGYELLIGFLHTIRLVQAEGMDIDAFAHRVGGTLSGYSPLLAAFAEAIKSGKYTPDLGPLHVQAALFDDLISHRESQGVETVRMREVKSLMDRRIAEGHGNQGFSSLFELLDKS